MTDENPEPDMVYMQLPPEVREMIEHNKMHAEANAHEVRDFLDGLTEEQLRVFRGILASLSINKRGIPYYMGLIGGLLSTKFGVCLACSKKHDDELKDMAGPGDGHERIILDPEDEPSPAEEAAVIADRQIRMAQYQVEPLTDNDWWGQVICTGPCEGAQGHATWKDLETREEDKPGEGGCTFCIQKVKHG